MAEALTVWVNRFWDDLQPTPGRLNSSLRIVLATVLTLILIMTLRMPQAALGLYFIFLIGRDSPSVSVRSGFFSLLALAASVATVLAVVSLTDNSPMARLLSVSIVTFLAGMLRFQEPQGATSLLDSVDQSLHSILTMPLERPENDKELVALPSSKIPIFIPGAFRRKETVAFALKISLCATVCYIIVRAVRYEELERIVETLRVLV